MLDEVGTTGRRSLDERDERSVDDNDADEDVSMVVSFVYLADTIAGNSPAMINLSATMICFQR